MNRSHRLLILAALCLSWLGATGTPIWYANGVLGSTTSTRYAEPWFGGTGTADTSGSFTTTEAQRQAKINNAGTYSRLYYNCSTYSGGASPVFGFRVGSANGNENITISSVAIFQDTSDSDTVATGNLINFSFGVTAAAALNASSIGQLFTPTAAGSVVSFMNDGDNASDTSASTPRPLAGQGQAGVATVEANSQWKIQRAGVLRNLNVNQNVYTSVTGNIRVRVGAANVNGIVTPTTTGQFADTSDSDSVSVGNLANYMANVTSGTNTNFGSTFIAVDFLDNALGTNYLGGSPNPATGTFAANLTTYLCIGTRMRNNTTEALASSTTSTAFTATGLQAYNSANTTTAATTMRFRQGAADGNQHLSIASGASGAFVSDTSDSDYVVPTAAIDTKLVVGATGTNIIFSSIGFSVNYFAGMPMAF